jgi:hypothetical protein
MAGTLITSTIQGATLTDGTNSTSTTNCIQGSAKAWVLFNSTGGTTPISASYNVSSVTYNSTGDYTVNFTSAFADAKYSAVICGDNAGTNVCSPKFNGTRTASAIQLLQTNSSSGALANQAFVSASVFR